MSDVLIVLGMHRSGTSLLANYLAQSGLSIGTDLLGSNWSNPAGHFENMDFLNFHNHLLAAHGLDFKVENPVSWRFSEADYAEGRRLVAKHGTQPPWGWKDPRTCLFMDFWLSIIDRPKCIGIYRHYRPVVNSLLARHYIPYRRKHFKLWRPFTLPGFIQKSRPLAQTYLRVWIHYNAMMLRAFDAMPDDFCLIPFEALSESNCIPYDILRDKWKIGLSVVPSIPKQEVMSKHTIDFKAQFDAEDEKRAEVIWKKLMEYTADVYTK